MKLNIKLLKIPYYSNEYAVFFYSNLRTGESVTLRDFLEKYIFVSDQEEEEDDSSRRKN